MQAFTGFAEVSAGAGIAYGSGLLAAPLGYAVMGHGLDHIFTGMKTAITGSHAETATSQIFQKTGVSKGTANLIDNGISTYGMVKGGSVALSTQAASFSRFHLHPKGIAIAAENLAKTSSNPNTSLHSSTTHTPLTPTNFFKNKTYSEMEVLFTKKFGPPRGVGPHNKSFYNSMTKRTFNLHKDPLHYDGKPHVDVRKRGLSSDYYKPFFLEE